MSDLAGLADRFWQFQCDEFPLVAIQAGVPTQATLLLRESVADHERRAAWSARLLEDLDTIDIAGLTPDDSAAWLLLRRELHLLVNQVREHAHLRPSLYPLGPEFLLGYWAGIATIQTLDDARLYLGRLRRVPEVLDDVIVTLRQGIAQGYRYPKVTIERAAAHVRGQIAAPVEESPFFGTLARAGARSDAIAALADECRAIVAERIYPAFKAYASFIEVDLGAVARDSTGCDTAIDGGGYYRHLITQHTSLDLSPDEIHETGLSEVRRLNAEMLAAVAAAGFPGDLAGYRQHIQNDESQFAASAEDLLAQIQITSKRIEAEIPRFFGRLPRITYAVKSIPEAIADKLPVAYAQPNPVDCSAPGIHWITSLPRKCPRYMHLPLALHEAWPGHLMHLAIIQELEHLPDFQRYGSLRYTACIEGWAVYCERLGAEMGFYDSPDLQYGRIEMEMWRAVRLVVDTGLHAKGWSRAQAVSFAREHLALPDATIDAEIDRYIGMPGQALAYQLGNLKIVALRERAESALGDDFDLRAFHEAILLAGPVTLPVLETIVERWVDVERHRPPTQTTATA